ncbi:unnamed protein product, partial [Didymodactylos carnosus]
TSLPSVQGDFGTDLADTSGNGQHPDKSGNDVLVGKASASASNTNVEANTECEFDETSAQTLGSDGSRHSSIRKRAAETYLSHANKKIKAYDDSRNELSKLMTVGDFVGIKIDKVDRTNTEPKILPCTIVEKKEHTVKVACVFGIIDAWWSFDDVIFLSSVPNDLVTLKLNDLDEITLITASRLYVRGNANGMVCSCKSGCKSKHCKCVRNNVKCSTKCHKANICCQNREG